MKYEGQSETAETRRRALAPGSGILAFILLAAPAWAEEPAPAQRYVQYGFTVQNATDQMVPVAELWVAAPLEETSALRRLDLDATPAHESSADRLGNRLLRFMFSNVPPYAVRIARVEATLALEAPPPSAENLDLWLKPDPLHAYDDEAFPRLAPEFPPGAPEQTARAIFDWVRSHLRDSGYDGTDRGALYALEQKRGDCTEFATLFVALCRRAGIPARSLGGYVVAQNAILNPAAFHNWAEYRLDGRWQLADPQAGIFAERADQYVATRVLGESDSPLGNFARFRCLGEGMKAEMNR